MQAIATVSPRLQPGERQYRVAPPPSVLVHSGPSSCQHSQATRSRLTTPLNCRSVTRRKICDPYAVLIMAGDSYAMMTAPGSGSTKPFQAFATSERQKLLKRGPSVLPARHLLTSSDRILQA